MNLRTLNLNLLKTLSVLLRTRSVTLASQELFLTQPAVSTALKQLRELFNDDLLTKGNDGLLSLTHKAKMIKPKLDQILKETENLVSLGLEKLNPEKINETFYIGLQGHVGSQIFPKLYEKLNAIAPNAKLIIKEITDISELGTKELYSFDFLIGVFQDIPKSYIHEPYFSDHFVCLSGIKKLNRQKQVSKNDLNNYQHVILSYVNNYTKTLGESILTSNGINRQNNIVLSDEILAAELAAKENLLLIMLKKRAAFFKKIFPLKMFELPFESPAVKTEILYKEMDANDPIKIWFKSLLFSLI